MTETPATESREPDPQSGSTVWDPSQSSDDSSSASSSAVEPAQTAAQTSAQTPAESAAPAQQPATQEDLLARTRASQTWIAIIVFAIVLILLLIFVLENTKKVEVSYFGATGQLPLAVAMLLSAVAGILLTAIAGTLRILQLRRRVRQGLER